MKKSLAHCLAAGALAVSALPLTSPGAAACGYYRPGLFTYIAVRPAPCVYQGDYMVQQWAAYDGPALIAPQPTYSPSPTVGGYVHGSYQAQPVVEIDPMPMYRRQRVVARGPVVHVRNELPPGKGKVQVVRARAEVRIYGSERMEIKLYRR